MANGTTAAVTEATRLDEIGFPEFTAKLISDTFDALVTANVRQTKSYIELVQEVAKPLAEFINDTEDDIGGEEILQFLAAVLPAATDSTDPTKVAVGSTLTEDDATTLNAALALPDEVDAEGDNQVAAKGDLDDNGVTAIMDAVAKRVAANRYGLLKEMVKQGVLRLVVENGLIETRLTFTTYGSSFYQQNADAYHRDNYRNRSRSRTAGIASLFANNSDRTDKTSVTVRTTKETQQDMSGSSVQIFGMVRLNFKTDYLPLPA